MKGTVLRPYTNDSLLYGTGNFLSVWQEDTLRAISECQMGDRDSYPGQYIHMLINEGFLLAEEVEKACMEWLAKGKFNVRFGGHGFDEVISMPSRVEPQFQKLSSFIADHFEELCCAIERNWSEHNLLFAASLAEDMTKNTWSKLDELFRDKYWTDMGIFENLYVRSAHATAMDREKCLQLIAKKARRIKRAQGNNNHILKPIVHMLRSHFGYTYERGLREHSLFQQTEARVQKWLDSQNAHMAL